MAMIFMRTSFGGLLPDLAGRYRELYMYGERRDCVSRVMSEGIREHARGHGGSPRDAVRAQEKNNS
jgi:hypothetical protein